jgi:TfoX/Sxy family transcriptional regulator of competence genes
MAHSPAELQKHVQAAAPHDIELRFKPMFGGIGVYADGRMCMLLWDGGLALKIGGAGRDRLLLLEGAKPLQYAPGAPPSKSYVVVPDSMLADRKLLRSWVEASAAFVKTIPIKPKRRRRDV